MPGRIFDHVFVAMLREEWRLHDRHFGGGRFALLPLFIAVMVAGAGWILLATGTHADRLVTGVHALALVFGLHTGSIALIGRDSARNLLGDLTLLVFSARTLPLSERRLLGTFVVKDVLYYAILFLLPMAVAVVLVVARTGAYRSSAAIATTGLFLWLALSGMFVLGLAVTIAAIGAVTVGVSRRTVLLVIGGGLTGAWILELPLAIVTPYGVFVEPSVPRLGMTLLALGAILLIGILTFDTDPRHHVRTVGPAYRQWLKHVDNPVATKTLLDIHRSSGGIGKVVFSAIILCGVTVVLIDFVETITGIAPAIGISFGAILGLTGFTTYNWLTQFDDMATYRSHPLDARDVFAGKFRAFFLVGPAIALCVYLPVVIWQPSSLLESVVGCVVLVGIACYIFGVSVLLTGLAPNEFLFDTERFAIFGLAMAVPLVPILVVAFALTPISQAALVLLGVSGVILGGVGLVLYRRAIPVWASQYRS